MVSDAPVVMITGGSSGIGRAACLTFASAGYRVAVHYYQGAERAAAVVRAIEEAGGTAKSWQADITDGASVRRMVDGVGEHFSRLDVVINNAGDPIARIPFSDLDETIWDRAVAINLKGPYLVSRAALPWLQNTGGGSIINVSTALVPLGSKGDQTHYVAAKAGVHGLTVSLSKELARWGIRVNCLAPGLVRTPLHERIGTGDRLAEGPAKSLLGRVGTPEEMAGILLFLASDTAGFMTGQIIYADGGR